ncbi:MAG: sodium/solute symporter [Thermoguttaceae bacterium]|nr:sodium/solute symporter [Thermoguttaceae bacterium]MDW8037227.1 sodium/solute symporter [Thermoguttaceae bacterium]
MYNAFDFLFFLGTLLGVMAVGFWTGRREKNSVSGYFRGGNQLPWYAIGFSIVAAGISSEQFVGEMGYAYKLGMPVVNWEWLVFPALSILLWIFVPLYVRHSVTTMPEYLQRRFGPTTRTIYAYLSTVSYIFVNFALVFYTGGYALEQMWGLDRLWAVWALALLTGLYTVYGGLSAVAWTSSLQCILLLGGGLYVFFAGLCAIQWDWQAMLGVGQQAHLAVPADHPELPWSALIILALSTNTWYYATNQYINQRCLAARDEWHAKMGVLFAGGLQLLMPLATCFPAMAYRVIQPNLSDHNAAYPALVAAFVPAGMRGLVAAAIVGAIMSTISGLVNSTSTIVTLDIVRRGVGRDWSEERLVRVGRWSGAAALLIGALFAPVVMRWESLFRYAQDIWAPMAAPVVVVFLTGALWEKADRRGADLCLWLALLTVPLTLAKSLLADLGVHFLPENLENPMVLAGAVSLVSWAMMAAFSYVRSWAAALGVALPIWAAIGWIAALSPPATALLTSAVMGLAVGIPLVRRNAPAEALWDRSMLQTPGPYSGYRSVWLWWSLCAAAFGVLYFLFW